jgi:hypothetical protein
VPCLSAVVRECGTKEEKWHPILGAPVEQHAESLNVSLNRRASRVLSSKRQTFHKRFRLATTLKFVEGSIRLRQSICWPIT